jgi:hypothetical protein
MRFYGIETDDANTVHVVSEHMSYIEEGRTLVVDKNGYEDPAMEGYWSHEELLALPGGSEALERWKRQDDEPYQRWSEREQAYIEAEGAVNDGADG